MRRMKIPIENFAGAAMLLFGLGFGYAQQPMADVNTSQTAPVKGSASGVKPKTMEEMVVGGKAAMAGAGEQAVPAKVAKLGDEGLKMHGHWTIDVRNPDGTLAEHRDFENSIQFGGQAYLVGLLAGYVVPADYEIFLQASGTNASPCLANGSQGCVIVRSSATSPGNVSCSSYLCSATLVYSTTQNYGSSANSFVLTGSATANQTGTIGYVSTHAGSCPAAPIQTTLGTVAPGSCPASSGSNTSLNALTGTFLGSAISVTAGQLVQVVVTITFS